VRRYLGLLVVLASAVFVAIGSAGRLTPSALYRALLAAPVPASSLPSGFAPPAGAEKTAASPDSEAHHAVGVVKIFLNGGADNGVVYFAGAYYVVFPNRQDAVAAYRAEPTAGREATPKSFPAPARIVNTSFPNGGARYVGVEYVDQNVRVFAYVINSGENPLPRDAVALALSLGEFTLTHLARVRDEG
jgi:hypothetical protein